MASSPGPIDRQSRWEGPAPLRGRRILVVEDSYMQAVVLVEWLGEAGATVVGPVATMSEAESLVAADAIDAALIDVNLGAGPDFRLAERLKDRHIPFLFTTAYDPAVIPQAFRSQEYLVKPLGPGQVVRALERLTGT